MMFLLTCDKKLTKSQLSPTHASTKRKITDELKHNAGWYEVAKTYKQNIADCTLNICILILIHSH